MGRKNGTLDRVQNLATSQTGATFNLVFDEATRVGESRRYNQGSEGKPPRIREQVFGSRPSIGGSSRSRSCGRRWKRPWDEIDPINKRLAPYV